MKVLISHLKYPIHPDIINLLKQKEVPHLIQLLDERDTIEAFKKDRYDLWLVVIHDKKEQKKFASRMTYIQKKLNIYPTTILLTSDNKKLKIEEFSKTNYYNSFKVPDQISEFDDFLIEQLY